MSITLCEKDLIRFGFSDCQLAPTPYDANVLLGDHLKYFQIIGSCIWLALKGLISCLF